MFIFPRTTYKAKNYQVEISFNWFQIRKNGISVLFFSFPLDPPRIPSSSCRAIQFGSFFHLSFTGRAIYVHIYFHEHSSSIFWLPTTCSKINFHHLRTCRTFWRLLLLIKLYRLHIIFLPPCTVYLATKSPKKQARAEIKFPGSLTLALVGCGETNCNTKKGCRL